MIVKKQLRKETLIIDSNLEEIKDYSKRKYATKIYIPEFNSLFNINSLGVISTENDELFSVYEEESIKKSFQEKRIKLYREKKNENL